MILDDNSMIHVRHNFLHKTYVANAILMSTYNIGCYEELAKLSLNLRLCVCVCVSVSTLSNMNISLTKGPIAIKFYLKHRWHRVKVA